MSDLKVQKFDTFEAWRQKANAAVQQLLDLSLAVSELSQNSTTNVGNLDDLNSANKTSIVAAINSVVIQLSSLSSIVGNTDALETSDKDSAVEAINEILQNLNSFKNTVNLRSTNLEYNSGRFTTSPLTSIEATTFSSINTLNLIPENSSVFSEGDKFVNDNLTYGGAGAAINQNIIDLLTTMSRIEKRYGVEFFTLKITAGAGTVNPIIRDTKTYHRMVKNASYVSNGLTYGFWFRVTAETTEGLGVFLDGTSCELRVNGVAYSNGKEIKIANGWAFVEIMSTPANDVEFVTNVVPMFGNNGNVIHIATPGLFDGQVSLSPFKGIKI